MFLSDLVNCKVVSPHSCLGFLENLTDVILEDGIPQVRPWTQFFQISDIVSYPVGIFQTRSDWYVFSVLHAFPWVAKELSDKKPLDFQRLIETIEKYLGRRQKLHVSMLRVWGTNRPHPQEEYLDCLWAQIGKLGMEGWQVLKCDQKCQRL